MSESTKSLPQIPFAEAARPVVLTLLVGLDERGESQWIKLEPEPGTPTEQSAMAAYALGRRGLVEHVQKGAQ